MKHGLQATPADGAAPRNMKLGHSARPFACRKGHERTPENTRIRKDGSRLCLECERIRDRQRRPPKTEWGKTRAAAKVAA